MKKLTLTKFRSGPGEVIHDVSHHGQSFLLTQWGKPVARLAPAEEDTVIERDGTIRGEVPLTFRTPLGDHY